MTIIEYMKKLNHEKLSLEDLKQDVALVSFTSRVSYEGFSGKFIIRWLTTLEEAMKMAEKHTKLELIEEGQEITKFKRDEKKAC